MLSFKQLYIVIYVFKLMYFLIALVDYIMNTHIHYSDVPSLSAVAV